MFVFPFQELFCRGQCRSTPCTTRMWRRTRSTLTRTPPPPGSPSSPPPCGRRWATCARCRCPWHARSLSSCRDTPTTSPSGRWTRTRGWGPSRTRSPSRSPESSIIHIQIPYRASSQSISRSSAWSPRSSQYQLEDSERAPPNRILPLKC